MIDQPGYWLITRCRASLVLVLGASVLHSQACLLHAIKSADILVQASRIAKLFAKHMKLAEQQEHLQQHQLCMAAGTPNRLCKLADIEALQLSQLRIIVLDVHQDAKKR